MSDKEFTDLAWEDPPTAMSHVQRDAEAWWDDLAHILRAHPGKWALIPRSHHLAKIKLNERGGLYEVTSRDQHSATKRRTYARFVETNE